MREYTMLFVVMGVLVNRIKKMDYFQFIRWKTNQNVLICNDISYENLVTVQKIAMNLPNTTVLQENRPKDKKIF